MKLRGFKHGERPFPGAALSGGKGAVRFFRVGGGGDVAAPGDGRSPRERRRICGYLMMEALVYIGLVFVVIAAGYTAMYRCTDDSVALRRSADDIARALDAGERWRADVRAAGGHIRLENPAAEPTLVLAEGEKEVAYRFADGTVFRRAGGGTWVRLLTNVKASAMTSDPRQNLTAWRWELELQPRSKGEVRPGRIRPLFTFFAVSAGSTVP